ncbi:PD40 domain-containing protein [Granulicella sp. dw_53]|uniref:TolB family protein n=1 Tax=Granulicella sp. dw_53 TaxID=2719792 RepID=UPI001BD1E14A|nr:PD40 domain-containing protein [Granulicella sp. dw_53]
MIRRSFVVAGLWGTLMCVAQAPPRSSSQEVLVFQQPENNWFLGYYAPVVLSPDATGALFGRGPGRVHLFALPTGSGEDTKLTAGLDSVDSAVFCGLGTPGLARHGSHGDEHGWFLPGRESDRVSSLPAGAMVGCSLDGSTIASFDPSAPDHGLSLGPRDHSRSYNPAGSVIAMAFSADGKVFYYLARDSKGVSSLSRVVVDTGETKVVADRLDGSSQGGQIALSPDGKSAYMALSSDKAPDDSMRHQPHVDRWLKIYKMDLNTGSVRLVVATPGRDNTGPVIADGNLYWTRSLINDSIITLPREGGAVTELIPGGQIPMWNRSGTKIAYFFGDVRMADFPMDLDDGVVGVGAEGNRSSEPSVIVSGYHEDFPPDWSPDGKWIVFHSHRSPGPVPGPRSPGSTDDLYLRRADDVHAPEIRLTNFGLETGPGYWSPDGQKLLMLSEQRGGAPGISKLWVLTLDTQKAVVLTTEMLSLPTTRSVLWAMWSPDGREIAVEDDRGAGKRTLWIVQSDGSHPQKVLDYEDTAYGGLDWSHDGKSIVYSGLAGDRMQLFSISRTGGVPQQLTHDSGNLMHPRVSPDGLRIACTRETQAKQIWRLPLN